MDRTPFTTPRIWISIFKNRVGNHRLVIRATFDAEGNRWQWRDTFQVVDDDGSGMTGPWFPPLGFCNETARNAKLAVQCYDDMYRRYVDPIWPHRRRIDRMMRWTHSLPAFRRSTILTYGSDELVHTDIDENGRRSSYVKGLPTHLIILNSSNWMIFVRTTGI